MIDYIKGQIIELTPTELVLENHGIGYSILISLQTYEAFQLQTQAVAYIHHYIREDEELFYGFATKDERELFRLLIGVSGIGVASARMMLSTLSSEEIRQAILAGDVNRIKSVKGIGLKSAQRLILELKDKVAKGEGAETPPSSRPTIPPWWTKPQPPLPCWDSPKPISARSCRAYSKNTPTQRWKTSSSLPCKNFNVPRGTIFELTTEINQQNGNIGGGDPGDSGSLSNGLGLVSFQFLATLNGQTLNLVKIKVGRNPDVLQARILLGL